MLKKSVVEQMLDRLRKSCKTEREVYGQFMAEVRGFAQQEAEPYFAMSDYHYMYNEQARSAVKKKKSEHATIGANDIITATQFFTPLPLVKYMVDNILSRLLGVDLGGYSHIIGGLGIPKSINSMRKLRILDPAVGTGNILYYIAKVLAEQYKKLGVAKAIIPKYVSENIVGIDIDSVATNFCQTELKEELGESPKIYCAKAPSAELESYICKYMEHKLLLKLKAFPLVGAMQKFDAGDISALKKLLSKSDTTHAKELNYYIKLAEALCSKYDAVIMNPPYLASADYNKELSQFINQHYAEDRQDLFSVFISMGIKMLNKGGYLGVVCPFNWMFIKQFTALREKVIANNCIHNLARLHISSYKSAKVFLSAFVLGNSIKEATGSYLELSSDKDSATAIENANSTGVGRYILSQKIFEAMPSSIIAYGHCDNFYKAMLLPKITDYMDIRQGMATGNNKKYLLPVSEVNKNDIDFSATSMAEFNANGKKYALYSKGGKFQKWYGNLDYVIRFEDEFVDIYKRTGNNMPSRAYYFKSGITWTLVSSKGVFGARIVDNSVFDVGGSCGFPKQEKDRYVILAYLCSVVATTFLNAFNPTMNCQVGDIKKLPYIPPQGEIYKEIDTLSKENVTLTKLNYDKAILGKLNEKETQKIHNIISQNEKRLNEIFISLYGLQGELSPEVEDRLITLEWN